MDESPAGPKAATPRVGVRELRQNLSVYLDRVKAGEPLLVSEHGRVVAVLRPLKDADDLIERLIALGLATRATRSICDLPPWRKSANCDRRRWVRTLRNRGAEDAEAS